MKRWLQLLFVGLLALTLVQCGPPSTPEPEEPAAPPAEATEAPPAEEPTAEPIEEPTEAPPAMPKILRVAATASVTTWDPSASFSTEALYMANIYEPLMWINPDGTFEPALAESWDISEDGLTWIFHLREGVTFHDGASLTAETVKASIERTIEFVKEIKPSNAAFGICTPYPGTELFDMVAEIRPEIKDGSDCDLRILHTSSFFNETFTELSAEELEEWMKIAYRRFYWRPGYLFKALTRISNLGELKRAIKGGIKTLDFSIRGG